MQLATSLSERGARRSHVLAAEVRRRGRGGMVLGGQRAPVRARAQVSEDGEDLELHAAQQQRGRRRLRRRICANHGERGG